MSDSLDHVAKGMAKATSRRTALKLLGAGIAATVFGAMTDSASAAPRTCITCICGNGRPCNPKSTTCTEVRGFSAEESCTAACERRGQHLCGLGNSFHCPKGCPA